MTDGKSRRPVTTRDIAEALGMNQSTVSRALRNDHSVSEKTRKKVQTKAKQLNYRPNPLVSAFTAQVRTYRRSATGATIALLDCYGKNQVSYFLDRYRKGVKERADELGFDIDTLSFEDMDQSIKRLSKVLYSRGIKGLIVLPVPAGIDLSDMRFDDIASATIDYSLASPNLHRATPDYFQGLWLAMDELHAAGYRRIGFVTEAVDHARIGRPWMGAYLAWREEHLDHKRIPVHIVSDWNRQAFFKWIDSAKPDVVLSNEYRFYEWMVERKMKIPRDIGFAGLCRDYRGKDASHIDQNRMTVGSSAVDLVVGQLYRNDYGLPELEKTVLIEGKWVAGDTTR